MADPPAFGFSDEADYVVSIEQVMSQAEVGMRRIAQVYDKRQEIGCLERVAGHPLSWRSMCPCARVPVYSTPAYPGLPGREGRGQGEERERPAYLYVCVLRTFGYSKDASQ